MSVETQLLVVDFGSQYTELIARQLRKLGVLAEVHSCTRIPPFGKQLRGIVLSGGPHSVLNKHHPHIDIHALPAQLPVLGICYGAQLIAQQLGGKIHAQNKWQEYGKATLQKKEVKNYLLAGLPTHSQVWMSHGDSITQLPINLCSTACSTHIAHAAFESKDGHWAGVQFHPEVLPTTEGERILSNFIDHCGCNRDWHPTAFIATATQHLKTLIGEKEHLIMAVSGGVDSSVAAALLHRVVGNRLKCVFVDNGLLRHKEYEEVMENYTEMGLDVQGIRAQKRFYTALQGVTDPEKKRKIIGRTFIEVFSEIAQTIPHIAWLAQGTIYSDRIESQATVGPAQTIKSHHNVGGLPKNLPFKVVEPIAMLFKDEVRKVGVTLQVPDKMLHRHPFPGPGLGIRIIGEVTEEKTSLLQAADAIFMQELHKADLYKQVWQAGSILLPIRSVGVQGDKRSYAQVLALRAVTSEDGMTAQVAELPHAFLNQVSTRIMNQVSGINRVVYDISSKPPATIEWE